MVRCADCTLSLTDPLHCPAWYLSRLDATLLSCQHQCASPMCVSVCVCVSTLGLNMQLTERDRNGEAKQKLGGVQSITLHAQYSLGHIQCSACQKTIMAKPYPLHQCVQTFYI